MNPPKVSVCIPVYNGGEFLRLAINSVLASTMQDYEIVVVDNCSTDNTCDIVRSYNDPRIHLYQIPTNIGMIGNFNAVLSRATGTYIKLLPADDLLYPGCLAQQSSVLDNDKEEKIALVSGARHIINDAGKVLFK